MGWCFRGSATGVTRGPGRPYASSTRNDFGPNPLEETQCLDTSATNAILLNGRPTIELYRGGDRASGIKLAIAK